MKAVYNYLYYHIFDLVSKIRSNNARESTISYLSVSIVFLTIPFIFGFINRYIINRPSLVLFLIVILGYGAIIFFLNKKYFENKKRISSILSRFKNESLFQRRIGYLIAVVFFLLSLVLFFIFLNLF